MKFKVDGIEIVDGIEYKIVTIRNRTKLIAYDGKALNYYRRNQKATIHNNADGYPCFGGSIPVHLYVACGWVDGYFEGAEVNHKDFNRQNYNADNLEWVTHEENVAYSLKNNYQNICLSKQGINNGRSIFTEEDILNIRKLYNDGYSIVDIVKLYHPELLTVKQYKSIHSTFSNIVHNKTWKNLL